MSTSQGIIMRHPKYCNQQLQFCEIGPGFSGIFPYLSEEINYERKPIIIDPAPYNSFLELLTKVEGLIGAQGEEIPNAEIKKVLSLRERDERSKRISRIKKNIEFYLNPEKVKFINKTLGDAIVEEDGLVGVLDEVPLASYSANHFQWGVGLSSDNKEKFLEILAENGLSRARKNLQGTATYEDVVQLMLRLSKRDKGRKLILP